MMGKPQSEPPTTWKDHPMVDFIKDAGGGIYYAVMNGEGELKDRIYVWHWHTPTEGAHRWSMSSVGNHTVEQEEPLTLSPSLACEDGCPSHGYLQNGSWKPV